MCPLPAPPAPKQSGFMRGMLVPAWGQGPRGFLTIRAGVPSPQDTVPSLGPACAKLLIVALTTDRALCKTSDCSSRDGSSSSGTRQWGSKQVQHQAPAGGSYFEGGPGRLADTYSGAREASICV